VIFVDRERHTNEDREELKEPLAGEGRLVLYDAEVGPIGGFADVRHRRRGKKQGDKDLRFGPDRD